MYFLVVFLELPVGTLPVVPVFLFLSSGSDANAGARLSVPVLLARACRRVRGVRSRRFL